MLPKKDIFPKTCGCCGESYSEEAWEELKYRGIQEGSYNTSDLELRNCSKCSSTMAVPVVDDIIRHEPPTPRMTPFVPVNKDSEVW